ncbi:hypothetical protein JZ751_003917, partial [Albula glossodonta]
MRVDFTVSWIFRGWVTHMIVTLCAQAASKPSCSLHQYVKDRRCCSKCPPGKYVLIACTSDSDTMCRDCGRDKYQPDWNNDTKCLSQKFCDTGKGFSHIRPQNPLAAVPCQCKPGFQCSLSNCEFCEKIKSCRPGYGLITDKSGRGSCTKCEDGHFSNDTSIEPCRPWTNCKELGKTEKQPGSDKADIVCGPLIAAFLCFNTGPSTSWVVVTVLSVIIVISLVILCLFCYKDRMEPLTENLRTCVQNLKRSRIQQETLSAPYSNSGPQNCTLYEITRLIHNEDNPHESLNSSTKERLANDVPASDEGEGPVRVCGEPLSEEPAPSPSSGSCSCVLSMKEPMEVGENEDCSQAVATGLTRACSCGSESEVGGGNPLRETSLCNNCSTCSLSACSSCTKWHGSCNVCLDFCRVTKDILGGGDNRQNEPCCCSIDSTTVPVLSSDSDNEQGLPLQDTCEQRLSLRDLNLDPNPEHSSHTSDLPMASGHVTGNNNTTFISNGQVMNFSGDVIVVYVSQNSQGSGEDPEEAFCS